MTSLQDRLKEILPQPLERGTMAHIAKLCDVSRPTVSAWFNNPEKVASISRSNAEKICTQYAPLISPVWLAEGAGPKHLPDGVHRVIANHPNIETGPDIKGKVPLVSWVQAGSWCEAFTTPDVSDAGRWLDCPVKHSPNTFVLRVRGDSMTAPSGSGRTYPEGCFIFVDPELRNPVNGDRVVACLHGANEATFKVFKDEDGRRWLQPLNPTHEPIRDPFKILGTVIGKWEDE